MINIIFNIVLSMSIIGGCLSILIFIMKAVTIRLFSAKWNYYIAFATILFFLFPVGLFIENIPDELIKDNFSQYNFQIEDPQGNLDSHKNKENAGGNQNTYTIHIQQGNDINQKSNMNIFRLALPYLSYVWLLGFLIFIVYRIIWYAKFKRKLLKTSFLIEEGISYEVFQRQKKKMGINQSIILCSNDRINTPILIGLIKSYVIIPEVEMNNCELRNIFHHELIHYKRKDLYLKVIVLVANAIHWFNPTIYKISEYMDEFCELSCDEKLIQYMSIEERRFYGETILNLLDRIANNQISIYTTLCKTRKSVKRRLELIMKKKKYSKKIIAISIFICTVFLITGTVLAHKVTSSLEISQVKYQKQDEENTLPVEEFFAELAEKQERIIEEKDIAMLMNPVSLGHITSPYGERINPITGEKLVHFGIDLAAQEGTDIVAAQHGKVIATHEELGGFDSYGNYIILAHDDGTASLYAHCSRLIVKLGDRVKKGEKIAEVGSTGYATGPHCHFEFRVNGDAIDPIPYM